MSHSPNYYWWRLKTEPAFHHGKLALFFFTKNVIMRCEVLRQKTVYKGEEHKTQVR